MLVVGLIFLGVIAIGGLTKSQLPPPASRARRAPSHASRRSRPPRSRDGLRGPARLDRPPGARGRARRGRRRGRPAPRDHRDRRPHREGGRPGAALPQRRRARRTRCSINQFGTERRMCLAFGEPSLDDVARELEDVLEMQPPQGLVEKVKGLGKLKRIADSVPKVVRSGPCQELVIEPRSRPAARSSTAGRATRRRSSRCRRSSRRTRGQAGATSACTGCRRSTRARRSCTGRSTRTAPPTGAGWATASRWPSRSGSIRSRRTRRALRCRSTSTSSCSPASCAASPSSS